VSSTTTEADYGATSAGSAKCVSSFACGSQFSAVKEKGI